jgi:ribose transport system permease protein
MGVGIWTAVRTKTWTFAALLSVVLIMANIIVEPKVLSAANLPSTLAAFAPFALLGLASMPSILSGNSGIDLSVAPLMGFVNAVMVTRLLGGPLGDPWFAIPILLTIGLLVGALNGIAVTILRFPAVIATLCSYFVLNGATLLIVPTPVTAPAGNWSEALAGTIWGVPGALFSLAVPILFWLVLRRTTYIRNLLSVGDNEVAAFTSGVRVGVIRVLAYALGGLLAACAGIALTGLVRTADANISQTYILVALAAVAIGGVKLTGGSGGILGPLFGAAAIYFLSVLLTTLLVPSTWINVAYGSALLVALLVNSIGSSSTKKGAARV